MNKKIIFACLVASFLVGLVACGDPLMSPKPRNYPRVIFPASREYKPFAENYCRFSFEQPVYANIVQDTSFFGEKPSNACWFDVDYPQFNGKIHFSYRPIEKKGDFMKFINDAHELIGKHTVKADGITEIPVENANGVSGIVFDLEGNVASPFQFYLTDSTKHFVRGALYFRTKSDADSLRPVVDFVKQDMMNMVQTFKWK